MTVMQSHVRKLGLVLMLLGIMIFLIMYNFSSTMLNLIDTGQIQASCMPIEGCPHIAVLNQAYLGYALAAVIFAIGLVMAVFGKAGKALPEAVMTNGREKEWAEKVKTLTGDEKLVYGKIMSAGGVIFQSDLVDQTEFPKAKISRILDRLEAGGLLERKRRGMANAVVLK